MGSRPTVNIIAYLYTGEDNEEAYELLSEEGLGDFCLSEYQDEAGAITVNQHITSGWGDTVSLDILLNKVADARVLLENFCGDYHISGYELTIGAIFD